MLVPIINEMIQSVIQEGGQRVGASYDGAQFDQEGGEGVALGGHDYCQATDVVVEVERGHVLHLEVVVVVGVLID